MTSTINASTTAGLVQTADTSGVLALQTAGTTAVSIDASQNVNFAGTAQRITGDFSNATTANRVAFQTSTANSNTNIYAIPNGTGVASGWNALNNADPTNASYIRTIINSNSYTAVESGINGTGTYLPMTFYTGGTESLRLSATTKAVILAGGSTSANGTGITFPATQSASTDANTLDDYEEGTWTPSLGGTTTYAKRVGEYVKVGQSVIYAGAISVTSIGTGSATGAISGLPFTASNIDVNAGKAGTVSFFNSLATSIASLGIYVDNAGTTLQTTTVAAGGATSTGTASIFQNSSKIDFAGSYKSSS